MDICKKQQIENNQLYKTHERAIDSIYDAIKREIPHLIHEFQQTVDQAQSVYDFTNDRATIFRFLRKNNYSTLTTLSLLLDTIQWRIQQNIDKITISTVKDRFLSTPLVYFHKKDKVNRPVLYVNLAYLPKAPEGCDVTEFLTPLVIFVLETARLLSWDMTQENIEAGVEYPLVLDTLVLIDFKNANSLPMDINLMKSFVALLRRYPGMPGTVNLINFSWIYQGLWQMCKLVLSDEAKSKVNFLKISNLKLLIDQGDLLEDFGGQDMYRWNLENDFCYAKYRAAAEPSKLFAESRCSSSTSIYYDTTDMFHNNNLAMTSLPRPRSPSSSYTTPMLLTPVLSHANMANVAKAYSNLTLQTKLNTTMLPRLRSTFKNLSLNQQERRDNRRYNENGVSARILSEKLRSAIVQQQNNYSETIDDGTNKPSRRGIKRSPPDYWVLRLLFNFENSARLFTLRMFKKIIKYRSTLYWVIACILLRNGAQDFFQHMLLAAMEIMLTGNNGSLTAKNPAGMLSPTIGQMTL